MPDETELLRLQRLVAINAEPGTREALEAQYGNVWDTDELRRDFFVKGFQAPYVVVVRRHANQLGSLEFQHDPRVYFNFIPHRP